MSESVEEPVPKLPRGRGIRLSGPQLFRILLTLVTLIGVIFLTRPCADSVSSFVTDFDNSGGSAMPKPGNVDQPAHYEQLKPGMTDEEIKAAIERSKSRNTPPGGSAETSLGSAGAGAGAGSAPVGAGSATK